jgi:hypothetical protein
MRSLRSESGYAVPLVLAVLAIVLGFGAAAVTIATHNVDRSEHDLRSARALAAADAGLDSAAYRMNKMLLATKVNSLMSTSTVNALIAEAGCLQVGAGDTLTATLTTSSACSASSEETVNALGGTATFKYFVKLRANVASGGHSVLERQVIAVGEAGGVVQRVSGLYRFDLQAPTTSTTTRVYYNECTAHDPASGTDPAAGCPSL